MNTRRHLTLGTRIRFKVLLVQGLSLRDSSIELECSPSTLSRELKRNESSRCSYDPLLAQDRAEEKKTITRKPVILDTNPTVLMEVLGLLRERRYSPEIISQVMREYTGMSLSHETIYQYIYLRARPTLKKELLKYLKQQKKRRGTKRKGLETRGKLPNVTEIHERPLSVENRGRYGHWEGDHIVGKDHKSAIGTIVERKSRYLMIVPLHRGKDAESTRIAFKDRFDTLPSKAKKTMTYDRGKEMSEHELFTDQSGVKVYFADPYSPWQRGTNENTNGLIRMWFPKGTDFSLVTREELQRVEDLINNRPRKCLDWKTPKEVLFGSVAFRS
jgi:transposase, IS30 family